MHLTISPKGVTVDGTPLQVAEGTLHVHDPHPDEPVRVTVDLLPTTLALANTAPTACTIDTDGLHDAYQRERQPPSERLGAR